MEDFTFLWSGASAGRAKRGSCRDGGAGFESRRAKDSLTRRRFKKGKVCGHEERTVTLFFILVSLHGPMRGNFSKKKQLSNAKSLKELDGLGCCEPSGKGQRSIGRTHRLFSCRCK